MTIAGAWGAWCRTRLLFRSLSRQPGLALVWLAIAFCGILFLITNRTPPDFDTASYVMMSVGTEWDEIAVAPFAYRPAFPEILGAFHRLTGLHIEAVYRVAAFLSSAGLVVVLGLIARRFVEDTPRMMLIALIGASGFWQIKYAAHFDTMIDIHAMFLVALGWYLILLGHALAAGMLGVVGLAGKEWLGITAAVSAYVLMFGKGAERRRKPVQAILIAVAAALVALGLRHFIDVVGTVQAFDPVNDPGWWDRLRHSTLSTNRLWNILFSVASFWVPVLVLVTRPQVITAVRYLATERLAGAFALHFGLVLVLTVLGGTNLGVFTSYAAPLLVTFLGIMAANGTTARELALVLLISVVFNRLLMGVPDHTVDLDAFLDHVPPYHVRVNDATWWRLAELVGWLTVGWIGAAGLRRWADRGPTVPATREAVEYSGGRDGSAADL